MRVQTRVAHQLRLHRAIHELSAGEFSDISVQSLANTAGYSRFHFARACCDLINVQPRELLRDIRLTKAAVALKSSRASISEIALDCGYAGLDVLCRAFKAKFGVTPSQFRQTCGLADIEPPRIRLSSGPYPLRMTERGETRLAVMRYVGDYQLTKEGWENLHPFAPKDGEFYVVYHDDYDTTPRSQTRADLGFVVEEGAPIPTELRELRLPAGPYIASGSLKDQDYGPAWEAIKSDWLPRSGRRPRNIPSIEVYDRWPIPYSSSTFRILLGLELALDF